ARRGGQRLVSTAQWFQGRCGGDPWWGDAAARNGTVGSSTVAEFLLWMHRLPCPRGSPPESGRFRRRWFPVGLLWPADRGVRYFVQTLRKSFRRIGGLFVRPAAVRF